MPTDRQQSLLDAVERCFEHRGIIKTTLGDVAAEAGVSRQTVYRYFGDREGLFRQVVLRNIERHWALIAVHLETVNGDALEQLTALVLYCVEAFPRDRSRDLLVQLNALDSGMAIALSEEGLAPALAVLQPWVEAARASGQLRTRVTAPLLAEWLYRLIYSYVSLPSPRLASRAELRWWLREVALAGLWVAEAGGDS